jgi:hypothetical protein
MQEIDSLFETIRICYKEFTGKDSVTGSTAMFYDDLHDNIKEALLQLSIIQGYSEKSRKQYPKEK